MSARKTSAEEQTQAIADVERLAHALYDEFVRSVDAAATHNCLSWSQQSRTFQEGYRRVVRNLLHRDVIRVGIRPCVEQSIKGQMSIEEGDTSASWTEAHGG